MHTSSIRHVHSASRVGKRSKSSCTLDYAKNRLNGVFAFGVQGAPSFGSQSMMRHALDRRSIRPWLRCIWAQLSLQPTMMLFAPHRQMSCNPGFLARSGVVRAAIPGVGRQRRQLPQRWNDELRFHRDSRLRIVALNESISRRHDPRFFIG